MKFGGEFEFDLNGKKQKCLLNLTTLGEVIEESGLELHEIFEGLQKQPLRVMPLLLWHGVKVACWAEDIEPEMSRNKFNALLGSCNWQDLTPKILATMGDEEDDAKKKQATTTKRTTTRAKK
jgi:hypothetical protein